MYVMYVMYVSIQYFRPGLRIHEGTDWVVVLEAASVDVPRRPESTWIGRRGPPSRLRASKVDRGGLSRGSGHRFGAIPVRFRGDLGSSEVVRASAGAVRGALSTKLNFFASANALESILPLPRPLWGALWRFLGALWGAWVALGAPLVGPMGALGASWGVSWNGLGRSGRPSGTPKAPRVLRRLILE